MPGNPTLTRPFKEHHFMDIGTISALVSPILSVAAIIISTVRVAHEKAPLRRFERLAALRASLPEGSQALRNTDKALSHLSSEIARSETYQRYLLRLMFFLLTLLAVGTIAIAAWSELRRIDGMNPQLLGFLFMAGILCALVSTVGLLLIFVMDFAESMSLAPVRRARRKAQRRKAKSDRARRKACKKRAATRRSDQKRASGARA